MCTVSIFAKIREISTAELRHRLLNGGVRLVECFSSFFFSSSALLLPVYPDVLSDVSPEFRLGVRLPKKAERERERERERETKRHDVNVYCMK